MLNIALPKGRMGKKIYELFEQVGYECPSIKDNNRKLVFYNEQTGVKYFWVKPSDVAIYVERGAADIGVVGKDVLMEQAADIYELLDLHMGVCQVAVAAKTGYVENPAYPLRVATKYPNIARRYYNQLNRQIEIIKLNGSIELAALIGLSDVIVDIVETGKTLKENKLTVTETITDSSARLIVNKAAYKFKEAQINELLSKLQEMDVSV